MSPDALIAWLQHTPLGHGVFIVAAFALFIAWGFACQSLRDRVDRVTTPRPLRPQR